MPGLAGVDEVTAGRDRVAEPARATCARRRCRRRARRVPRRCRSSVAARSPRGSRGRTRRRCRTARCRLQLRCLDQRLAVAHVALGIVAQHDRFGALGAGGERVQHVAAAAGRDVDDAHRRAARPQAPHRLAQQLLDMPLSLPDAAPADRFEIDAVDEPADRRAPARFVPVDVVERAARIETGLVAEANALRQEAAEPQPRARRAPVEAARRRARAAAAPSASASTLVNPRRCAIAEVGSRRRARRRARAGIAARRASGSARSFSPSVSWKNPGRTCFSLCAVPSRSKNACCGA